MIDYISYPTVSKVGKCETVWSGPYGDYHIETKNSLKMYDRLELLQLLYSNGITDKNIENLENVFLIEILMSLHRRYNNSGYYDLIKQEISKKMYYKECDSGNQYKSDLLAQEVFVLNHIGSGMGYSQVAIKNLLGYSQQNISKIIANCYHPNIKLNGVIEYMTKSELADWRVADWIRPQDGKTTGQRLTDNQINDLKGLIIKGFDKNAIQKQTGISMQTINKYIKQVVGS